MRLLQMQQMRRKNFTVSVGFPIFIDYRFLLISDSFKLQSQCVTIPLMLRIEVIQAALNAAESAKIIQPVGANKSAVSGESEKEESERDVVEKLAEEESSDDAGMFRNCYF